MITDRTLTARQVRTLPDDHRDEIRAFVDAIDPRGHGSVTEITYQVVDCPLIRVTRRVTDEHGNAQYDEAIDGYVREQYDVPITAPLPSWWRPAS